MKYELVSFSLCPYVQRAVITLKHKNVPFTFREIDLENPPEWFNKISPLGKVPVLVVDGKTAIFESAVINEFIDETTPPQLLTSDPLERARERAWIQYVGELMMENYMLVNEEDRSQISAKQKEFFESLARLEAEVAGPCFRGSNLSLMDAAIAPLFLRLSLVDQLWKDPAWKQMPKVRKWAETLNGMPVVKESVRPDFPSAFKGYLQKSGSNFA